MSLCCHNCGQDMGPSDTFPGREGTMVFPNVLSFIWVAEEPNPKWSIHYIQPYVDLSLCFECIAKKVPNKRQGVLNAVYSAYEAEINYRRNQESEMIGGDDLLRGPGLFDEWEAKVKMIPNHECIFCGAKIPDSKNPCFTAKVIDKVYSQKNLSWFNQNYSWSNMEVGMTIFNICFKCLKDNFPRLYEDLSYTLRGVAKSNLKDVVKNEVFLTQDFAEALKREVGDTKAQGLLDELSEQAEVKLVVDPGENIQPN